MSRESNIQRYRARAQNVVDGREPYDGASIAQGLEDEIERRGLRWAYIRMLMQIVAPGAEQAAPDLWYVNHLDIFLLIRATPEQRARAFLAAVL